MYNIMIIGGGPAGATLVRLIGGSYNVLLLERRAFQPPCTGSGRVGLIGEAAGFISPSSAEGISYSFRSALALSRALSKDTEKWPRLYHANTAYLRRNIFFKRLKLPFMYNKQIRKVIIRSGLSSVDIE